MAFEIFNLIKRFKVFFISISIAIVLFIYHLFLSNDKQKMKDDKKIVVDWYKNKQIEIIKNQNDMIEKKISLDESSLESNEVKIENVNESESKELLDNISDIKHLGY